MNWEALGAIGELLAALGVIVSLVYLGIQIRQNTNTVRATAFQSLATSAAQFLDGLAQDPELTELFWSGMESHESLRPDEQRRFSILMGSVFRRNESAFNQWRRGLIDDAEWDGLLRTVRFIASSPGVAAWWRQRHALYHQQFQDFVETELLRRPRGGASQQDAEGDRP